MRLGHENCGRDVNVTEISSVGGEIMRRDEEITCHHDHREKLYASDDLGIGYPVGVYCECCDRLVERY